MSLQSRVIHLVTSTFGYILQLLPLKMSPVKGKKKKKNPRKYLHCLNVGQAATPVARRMWHPLPYPCEEGKVITRKKGLLGG